MINIFCWNLMLQKSMTIDDIVLLPNLNISFIFLPAFFYTVSLLPIFVRGVRTLTGCKTSNVCNVYSI